MPFLPQNPKNKHLVVFTFLKNKQMVVCVLYNVDNEPNKNKQMVVSENAKTSKWLFCHKIANF